MARPYKWVTFHHRVAEKTAKNAETGCWEWTGCKDKCGYGRINRDGKLVRLHREAWKDVHGPIPQGKEICHRCDNPSCINPDHLFAGTHTENMRDMVKKGRCGDFRGEKSSTAKLSATQVLEIAKRLSDGEACSSIGRAYGVTDGTINHIRRGRNWKSVTGVAA